MICLCTCTGGSASTIGPSKRRATTASCKTCGGKPLVDGKVSSSNSLLGTVLELTSLMNSDLTWSKVSKGYRSSSRRPRRSVKINLKAVGDLVNKDSKELEMPVSESEKLGVSVLGCRFSEKAEHVPIKKRRFLFKTPSQPHESLSPCSEGPERHTKSLNASSQMSQLDTNANCLPAVSASAVDLGLPGNKDNKIDGKRLVKGGENVGGDEDFSGISILAAAACSNSLGGDVDCNEGSGVVSSGKGSLKASINVGSKEDLVKSANMSTEGTDVCIPTALSKGDAFFRMDNSSPDKDILDGSSSPVHSVEEPEQVPLSKKNLGASEARESSARDDRLHWDLNTVMDAWERPFDSQHEVSPPDVVDSNLKYAEDEKHGDEKGNSSHELGRELGGAYDDIGKALIPVESRSLAHETESKMEEHKLAGRADISGALIFQANLLPSDFDSATNDLVKETRSSHDEQREIPKDGSLVPDPRKLAPAHATSTISAKFVNLSCKRTDDLSCHEVDCSLPPGLDHLTSMHVSEENCNALLTVVGCGNNVNNPITDLQTLGTISSRSETMKQNFSPTAVAFPENFSLTTVDCQSPVEAEKKDQPAEASSMHDTAEPGTEVHISAKKLPSTTASVKSMMLLTGPSCLTSNDEQTKHYNDLMSCTSKGTLEVPLDNDFGSDISQGDIRPRGGLDKLDEHSAEYDSQYEDGELRESSVHTWEGYEGEDGEPEYGSDNKGTVSNLGIANAQESRFQYGQEGSSRIRVDDAGSGRGSDVQSSAPCLMKVLLSEKVDSGDKGSGSGPDEMISGNGNKERQNDLKDASQSAEWKTNLSKWDLLPENRRSSSGIVTKFRDCSSRNISYGDQKDGMEAEDMETKVNGYRRESLSRTGRSSSRDAFLSGARFRMQGCSFNNADDSNSRSERESGPFRSFGRGRYSPHIHARGRRGDNWTHSPESDRGLKRHRSPSYQVTAFRRSGPEDVASDDIITKGGGMESSDAGRQTTNSSSYVTRRSFRSRSPTDRQGGFRLRLGVRPTGDTSHDRFVTVGRGRSVRYGSRFNGGGPRGRYHGPANDDCDEFSSDYFHPLSRRRRCFSPIERRGNPYAHHRSISRSPSRSRTRSPLDNSGFRRRSSRSPNFRADARMRRPRSPNLRSGFESDHLNGFMSGPRNHTSPPPNSGWVNYKQRSSAFDRRSPGRIIPRGERFGFYDSSRKPKQNEYYRSGHPGRFSELNGAGRGGPRYEGNDDERRNHGYRRGFMRRYDMDGAVKRFHYYDGDEFSPGYDSRDNDVSEFHGRGNTKSNSSGIDSRIGDFPRRPREGRDPLINRRDGKFNTNADLKSLGLREGEEDVAASSRTRPS